MKTLMQLVDEAVALAQAGFIDTVRAEELRTRSEKLEAHRAQAEEYGVAYAESEAGARERLDGSQLTLDLWRSEFRLLVSARRSARVAAEQLDFIREVVERETAAAAHRKARGEKYEVQA
ncbi:hypothetical protein [Hyalangium versicolor]|uniref:hypothetical protein n=1 Tax=Hyalangium versicolor TaxID=2861190 RepID=UPI001CCD81DB|nr:hypothetical protein [Hyalangium versicolor]